MTVYHIQTPAGKEGPFSVEELRRKNISADTLISQDGREWKAAGKIDALRPILPEEGPPLHFKKHEGPKYSFTADAIKEPATRSRFSVLQWTTMILLVINGAVYIYKQKDDSAPAEKKEVVALSAVPVKEDPVYTAVQEPVKATAAAADTTIQVRNNWTNYIKASHNNYKYYTKLGGIRQLKAIVQNETDFPLDTVKVAVKYLRKGELFKTEYVTLVNIPEHGELAVAAPNSKSGTNVILDITEITSQKMQFFYSAGLTAEAGEDPYFKL
jgi:hypothetical protein